MALAAAQLVIFPVPGQQVIQNPIGNQEIFNLLHRQGRFLGRDILFLNEAVWTLPR